MSDQFKRRLLASVVAVGLAVAVSYGLISQQTANQIQTTADQAIQGNQTTSAPALQQPAPLSPTIPAPPQPAPQAPASTTAPRQ